MRVSEKFSSRMVYFVNYFDWVFYVLLNGRWIPFEFIMEFDVTVRVKLWLLKLFL